MKFRLSMPLAIALAVAAPAFATTMLKQELPELTKDSDAVVRGKVTRVESHWTADHRRIVTEIDVAVAETLKGAPGEKVTIVQPGGVVGDIGQRVDGMAQFKEGEECVLFLEKRGPSYSVVGMSQGKLNVARSSDGTAVFAVPSKVDAVLVDPSTRTEVPSRTQSVTLDSLRTTVRGGSEKTTP